MSAVHYAEAFDHFSNNRLFEGIRPDLLEEVAHELRIVRLSEGEVIFREGHGCWLGADTCKQWLQASCEGRSNGSTMPGNNSLSRK